MKKLLRKKKKGLLDYKSKIIYDPRLDEVDVEKMKLPQKYVAANERLKNMKFPENFFKPPQQ
jgi:hypothetical protein